MENTPDLLEGLLTADQLQQQLHIKSRQTVRNMIARGMPGVIKLGQKMLFDAAKVRAWIEQHEIDKSPRKQGRPKKS